MKAIMEAGGLSYVYFHDEAGPAMLLGHPVGPRETRDLSLVTGVLGQVIVAGGVATLALGVLALRSWGAWPSR
jgi:hypothetical protein